MPEILTESFCERCGTRYTFESTAPRGARLKGLKVVSRGLRNFVMSDDTSMDEAMAAARSETDRDATTQQLDAFHKTFNFCMSCRQYTCGNCWNDAEGRCLSCAPHLGHDVLEAPFPNLAAGDLASVAGNGHATGETNGHAELARPGPMAWPTSDLMREDEIEAPPEPAADDAIHAQTETAPAQAIVDASDPLTDTPAAADDLAAAEEAAAAEAAAAVAAEAAEAAAETEAAAAEVAAREAIQAAETATQSADEGTDDRAASAAAETAALLGRFRPGQSLDDEIDAFEHHRADSLTPPGSIALEPQPVAAEPEPEPEVVATQPEPEPVAAAPEPRPEPTAPTRDVVPQPTWQIVAPDDVSTPTPPAGPLAPDRDEVAASAEPQWPSQPEWPSHRPAAGLPGFGRPATPTGGMEALWAESAREVASPTSGIPAAKTAGVVQPCVSCGLSLSATARFCRRCGSRQG